MEQEIGLKVRGWFRVSGLGFRVSEKRCASAPTLGMTSWLACPNCTRVYGRSWRGSVEECCQGFPIPAESSPLSLGFEACQGLGSRAAGDQGK